MVRRMRNGQDMSLATIKMRPYQVKVSFISLKKSDYDKSMTHNFNINFSYLRHKVFPATKMRFTSSSKGPPQGHPTNLHLV